ncbi:MAG TPA: hypothetical protein VNW92_00860 [Polyangiaceae bacterium]|nr:hypothetical protein [Polyangiaceae bacterium]
MGAEILTNVSPTDGADSIEFNGVHFYFAAKTIDADLQTVLTSAAAICEREGADMARELEPVVGQLPIGKAVGDPSAGRDLALDKLLMIENEGDRAGEVGCWVRRSTNPSRGILDRVRRFAETADLSEFGSLQYIHAEQHGKRTSVRLLWSEGPISITSMFPKQGDTPGRDLDSLPRPPGSARILFGQIQGTKREVVGYRATQTPEQVNSFYARELPSLGWKEIDLGVTPDTDGAKVPLRHAYEQGQRRALLAVTPNDDSTGATWVEFPTGSTD